MEDLDHFDESHDGVDFSNQKVEGTYEACHFRNCNFTNANFTKTTFVDCSFEICDLSNANLDRASFRDVVFRESKLIGWRFDFLDFFQFKIRCEECSLDYASFFEVDGQVCEFMNCRFLEVDFESANFSEVGFAGCDFSGSKFERTQLEGADFREALNFSISPSKNNIKHAKFAKENLEGLLDGFGIIIE